MVHGIKNSETKKLLRLGIYIKLVGWIAGLAVVAGLIYAFGTSVSTIIGVYLGYRVLRLIMRLFGQMLSLVFTVVSILILVAVISLIII
jgi:hypothetical protein